MNDSRKLEQLLQDFGSAYPRDAVELRRAASNIVSAWIRENRQYPDDTVDIFVHIESELEQSIHDYQNDPVNMTNECEDSYKFYIEIFKKALVELRERV